MPPMELNMWYDFNISKLPALLLPGLVQRPLVYALLHAILKPIKTIFEDWDTFRNANVYAMAPGVLYGGSAQRSL